MKKSLILLPALLLSLLGVMACSSNATDQNNENTEALAQNNQDPMDILLTRRSIRQYKEELPSQDLIEKVAEAGTYAPSAMNRQPTTIVAVTDKATRDKLAQLSMQVRDTDQDTFYGAPAVMVVLGDRDIAETTYLQDASLVVGNMQNAAHALGLGTCWVNSAKEVFETEEGKALLKEWGLEGNYEGVSFCILGIPNEKPEPAPRKENYVIYIK